MDFIFGSDKDDTKPTKKHNKQLKTQIVIKQNTNKPKQVSSLQKFKAQAKKKLMDESNHLEIDEVQSNQFVQQKSSKQFDSIDHNVVVSKLLQGDLSLSEMGVKFLDKKLIGDRIADVQNLVYNAQTSQQPANYVKGIYENIYPDNEFIKQGVDQTMNNALKSIKNQIQQPRSGRKKKINVQKRRVPKTKDDLKQLQKLDKYRFIKIKQGQVKSKVGDLRSQLEREYYMNKDRLKFDTSDIVDTNYYSIDHPQTIKAQHMIHRLQEKRKSQHKRYKQHLQQKQSQKQRIQRIQQQYQQKLKQQRKQKLKQFYQQKWQQRQSVKQQLKKKQQQFSKWIKMYKRQKPLQQKNQQQLVMKVIVPQIQQRHKKLMKIKQIHKPIDMEQINSHDHRYMELKNDQLIRQKAQIEMKLENDQINQEHISRYYKGKYRYMALQSIYEEKNQIDPKEVERSKKQRQLAYSDQIRYYHKEAVKKKQSAMQDTRSLIRRVRNHNGSVSVNENRENKLIQGDQSFDRRHQTLDPRSQGLKNLQYIKSHIRQKLMNGQEKKPKINLIQIRQNRDYLSQIRQQRKQNTINFRQKTNGNQQKLKNSSILSTKARNQLSTSLDLQSLKVKAQIFDERVKRNQMKHKLSKGQNNYQDSQQLQDDYVKAINSKLKLVQQLK